jgi:hypothetical protein
MRRYAANPVLAAMAARRAVDLRAIFVNLVERR